MSPASLASVARSPSRAPATPDSSRTAGSSSCAARHNGDNGPAPPALSHTQAARDPGRADLIHQEPRQCPRATVDVKYSLPRSRIHCLDEPVGQRPGEAPSEQVVLRGGIEVHWR